MSINRTDCGKFDKHDKNVGMAGVHPFWKGWQHGVLGYDEDNPHPPDTRDHAAWRHGWEEGREDGFE